MITLKRKEKCLWAFSQHIPCMLLLNKFPPFPYPHCSAHNNNNNNNNYTSLALTVCQSQHFPWIISFNYSRVFLFISFLPSPTLRPILHMLKRESDHATACIKATQPLGLLGYSPASPVLFLTSHLVLSPISPSVAAFIWHLLSISVHFPGLNPLLRTEAPHW